MIEAKYYVKQKNGFIRCTLCPHFCELEEGMTGFCNARRVQNGKLLTLNYEKSISLSIDPIEKKPLYHFYPGTKILSIGANSCNFDCDFCQNYEVSRLPHKTFDITKEKLLEIILSYNLNLLAFTYTEPITWYEFILDSAKFLKKHNIKIVLVTNGYINSEPLKELLPFVDALNIDLKSFNDDFYNKYCKGMIKPVLNTIKIVREAGKHLEITNLQIPSLNDSENEIDKMCEWISSISSNIPLHISRYFPYNKMTLPPTSEKSLTISYKIATNYLKYVYLGNINCSEEKNTYCPNCGSLLIERNYWDISIKNFKEGKCNYCNEEIYGCW